ncbi:MAG: phosphotransferase, partial [Nitrososphaeraceae archaeon]|nr:phosphotransferase [Nitrososphaeraceae archaeon]
FMAAEKETLVDGIKIPNYEIINENSYLMEFFSGLPMSQEVSTIPLHIVLSQVEIWSIIPSNSIGTWDDYLERLESHVKISNSKIMIETMGWVEKQKPLPNSFCHGDYTLENILINEKEICLIDPNYEPTLFQSHILDLGKLLQSTLFDYHNRFSSYGGISLKSHKELILKYLDKKDILRESILAYITHIMRLRKYRPPHQQLEVDDYLLGKDYENYLLDL